MSIFTRDVVILLQLETRGNKAYKKQQIKNKMKTDVEIEN